MTPVPNRCSLRFCPQPLRRTVKSIGTVGLAWAGLISTSWGQQYVMEEPEPRSYVVSYMLIVFAVSFGLMMICRSGKRMTSFHREE